ncbi:MAG: hypothetical protein L6R38_005679 [Xanthoria sp. 2 TBL-2021]|nr:MAG: hypothetical protein L6R38_005679 [Xanthoria sp. 2 TBL-2021]
MNSFPRRVILKTIALITLLWQFCIFTDCDIRSAFSLYQLISYPNQNLTKVPQVEGGTNDSFGAAISAALLEEKERSQDSYEANNRFIDVNLQTVLEPQDHNGSSPLLCQRPLKDRYGHLRSFESKKPRFFFALDLYQAAGILPQLTSSILEAVKFLGPEYCYLSIVEGNSTDGTSDFLQALYKETKPLGLSYSLVRSDLDPKNETQDRIELLAQLRNLALAPLLENPADFDSTETTIIFINDISPCVNDILELIHQRRVQGADLACLMDYSDDSLFYDIWVARSMTGDIFFDIPPSGLWKYAKNLLWDDPDRKRRLEAHKPFQAFACWNGMVTMSAKAFIEKGIRFRRNREGECYMGEPTLLAKDFWKEGFGKILVVPSVWVAYSYGASVKVKMEKGYVEENVEERKMEDGLQEKIEWDEKSPSLIKCPIPSYSEPQWVPPYEGFVDNLGVKEENINI